MNASVAIRSKGRYREGIRVSSRAKSQVLPMTVQASVVFLVVFILGNFAFSLTAHILAEGQRAQIKSMTKPLAMAREEDRQMKTALTSDKSQESIAEWADQRGFVRKYGPIVTQQETLLAQN
ncbi:MAG: hypothetical protein JST12_20695 [Armatimonadetes bacterium]|nr:hypothetical protein [Armatimonadota bacterium]MBS1704094.1 hypothetical protein [Armatimonadota bacterium]MBS1725562.1 hypothetical protein [Armatimonadota bacterium]